MIVTQLCLWDEMPRVLLLYHHLGDFDFVSQSYFDADYSPNFFDFSFLIHEMGQVMHNVWQVLITVPNSLWCSINCIDNHDNFYSDNMRKKDEKIQPN